ncbi:MAG: N-acetylmuramoyl-L-alanine amidase [candidate division WOR-3 bacterium]
MMFLIFINILLNPPEIVQKKDTVYITFDVKGPLRYEKFLKDLKLEIKIKDIDSLFPFSSKLSNPILKGIEIKKIESDALILLELSFLCKNYRIENKRDYFRLILRGNVPDSLFKAEEKREKPKPISENKKLRDIKKIVIDPGHGGRDYGAVSKKGTKEKDINLKVAKFLKEELKKEGFEVFLTREEDTFITLSDRTKFANKIGADLFISLHCNASPKVTETSNGVEVYFLSEAKTDWERAVAALENASLKYEYPNEKVPDGIIEAILMDMAQTEYLYESQKLAEVLQKSISKELNIQDRGVKQAGFYVLNGCYSPAVLVEMGFITTPSDEKLLKDEKYQKNITKAIVQGVKKFKEWFEKTSNFTQ